MHYLAEISQISIDLQLKFHPHQKNESCTVMIIVVLLMEEKNGKNDV